MSDGDVVVFVPAISFTPTAGVKQTCLDAGAAELAARSNGGNPPLYGGALASFATFIQMPGVPAGTDTAYDLCFARVPDDGDGRRRLSEGGTTTEKYYYYYGGDEGNIFRTYDYVHLPQIQVVLSHCRRRRRHRSRRRSRRRCRRRPLPAGGAWRPAAAAAAVRAAARAAAAVAAAALLAAVAAAIAAVAAAAAAVRVRVAVPVLLGRRPLPQFRCDAAQRVRRGGDAPGQHGHRQRRVRRRDGPAVRIVV